MIKNYFLLFFRNLKRQKLFSIINLLGLTVSMVSTMLIYLYVREEFSFDRFHNDAENIYRVNQTFIWGENTNNEFASTGPGVAYALKEELPELKLITSIHTPGNYIFSYVKPDRAVVSFEETRVLAADSNFFSMFNFPIVAGNTHDPLKQAGTMVMTESTARKYFGKENPVGKLVRLGSLGEGAEQKTYEVTAVLKDLPENSYFKFNVLLSMTSFPIVKRIYWSWIWTQLETYVKLDPKVSLKDTKAKLVGIPRKYAEETLEKAMNTTFDEYTKSGKKWELFLQPLTSIHLPDAIVYNRIGDSGDVIIVYSLIGAAFFIILLSCVNFMNLSTAQFTRRIKEASVRKILGLGKKELSLGYFAEALTFCVIALLTSLAAAQVLLPGFNYITGKNLQLSLIHDSNLVFSLIGLVIFMAIISSSYPAIYLSGFNPVDAMRGKLKSGREGKFLRNGLVVFQFAVSIILLICTAVVFQQLNFISNKNPGFDRANLVVVKHVEGIANAEAFVNQIKQIPGIEDVSWSNTVPPNPNMGGDKFTAQGMNGQTFPLNYTKGDEHFIPTLNIKIKYGRNFSASFPGDENRVILNESAIKKMGWDVNESVIGRKLEYPGEGMEFEIAGVVADYNYWTLAAPIEPMGIFYITNKRVFSPQDQFAVIRLAPTNGDLWKTTMGQIEAVWKVRTEGTPFQYEFVDNAFAETFKTQAQLGNVLNVMAALAILIACLGLLGMIIYSLEQRSKEIGIRKVSGASVMNILTLISSSYTKLIIVAFVIGAPLSWYLMTQWLRQFNVKTEMSPVIFIAAGAGILLMATLITGYHSVKAAMMNPVDVLRDE